MSAIGQIRWATLWCNNPIHHHNHHTERRECSSKPAINIYAPGQKFIAGIEHPDDIAYFESTIVAALKKISEEQVRRTAFVSDAGEVVGAAV